MRRLFVGVTSWNSERFLRLSLPAIRETASASDLRVTVWDNCSQDGSAEIARSCGAEVVSRRSSQAEALNGLLSASDAEWVLLMHADVIMLDSHWLELCTRRALEPEIALVSPEDIGCGPYTRPFGLGMPESSFLFFNRRRVERARTIRWGRWRGVPVPRRSLDFSAPHLTHSLPDQLANVGLGWSAMNVQPSDRLSEPKYGPYPEAAVWSGELAYLRYGLGNFYSIDGVVTHYHNWYERVPPTREGARERLGEHNFPAAFIGDYTQAFLDDYESGLLIVPAAKTRDREPVAL